MQTRPYTGHLFAPFRDVPMLNLLELRISATIMPRRMEQSLIGVVTGMALNLKIQGIMSTKCSKI